MRRQHTAQKKIIYLTIFARNTERGTELNRGINSSKTYQTINDLYHRCVSVKHNSTTKRDGWRLYTIILYMPEHYKQHDTSDFDWYSKIILLLEPDEMGRGKKNSHGTLIDWCTGREWPVNCMTVISAWWRSNMRFQRSSRRLSGRWTII